MSGIEGGRAPTGPPAFGVTWGGLPQHATRIATVATAAAVVMGMAAPVAQATTEEPGAPVEVIVQEAPGAGNGPERAIAALGGTLQEPLGIIGGFTATVPQNRVDALRSVLGVRAVTENAAVDLHDAETVAQKDQPGSLYTITHEVIGAANMWDRGFTGKGWGG